MGNKKYSIALGGGVARGFIHIGVLKYLEEKGVKIEEISGASMGSLIASLKAKGYSSDEMIGIFKKVNYFKLIDIDLTRGIIKGKKIYKEFEKYFGDSQIEDLDLKLKIVATNIETSEKMVFDSGKVADAVRASMSLPGIFVPWKIDNSYYVDGGLSDNMPIDVLEGENIIGVSALRDNYKPLQLDGKLSYFSIKNGFLNYNFQLIHRMFLILIKQNETKAINKLKKQGIVISPKFKEADFMSFDKIDEFVELGYNEIKKTIEKNNIEL